MHVLLPGREQQPRQQLHAADAPRNGIRTRRPGQQRRQRRRRHHHHHRQRPPPLARRQGGAVGTQARRRRQARPRRGRPQGPRPQGRPQARPRGPWPWASRRRRSVVCVAWREREGGQARGSRRTAGRVPDHGATAAAGGAEPHRAGTGARRRAGASSERPWPRPRQRAADGRAQRRPRPRGRLAGGRAWCAAAADLLALFVARPTRPRPRTTFGPGPGRAQRDGSGLRRWENAVQMCTMCKLQCRSDMAEEEGQDQRAACHHAVEPAAHVAAALLNVQRQRALHGAASPQKDRWSITERRLAAADGARDVRGWWPAGADVRCTLQHARTARARRPSRS